jgi:GNAT superfamily N-acetyltransferase
MQKPGIKISLLQANDEAAAVRIFQKAFGTWLGVPDPEHFFADRDYVRGRRAAPHVRALAAHRDGTLVGSNFVTRWGSVGFFGPLTVEPTLQNTGIAQALLETTVEQFESWGTRCAGLFTFAESPKHVALYQRYGFQPRYLTIVMAKPVQNPATAPDGITRFSEQSLEAHPALLGAMSALTNDIYPGLDVRAEISAIASLGLGETLILHSGSQIEGFALCHHGPRSEAGAATLLVKFAAIRPGPQAKRSFEILMGAAGSEANRCGATTLMAGTSTARRECHGALLELGFRGAIHGIAMHRHDEPGYSRSGVYVIDDWR